MAITLCAHTSLGTQPVYLFGTEEQKERLLPDLTSGRKLGAFGLTEPEAKRKAIGDTFVEVFDREAVRLGLTDHLLGQGTIYPDTIETGGTKRSDTIKTHHNRNLTIDISIDRECNPQQQPRL